MYASQYSGRMSGTRFRYQQNCTLYHIDGPIVPVGLSGDYTQRMQFVRVVWIPRQDLSLKSFCLCQPA